MLRYARPGTDVIIPGWTALRMLVGTSRCEASEALENGSNCAILDSDAINLD